MTRSRICARLGAVLLALLLLPILVGQGLRIARPAPTPPGALVAVEGARMHLVCAGAEGDGPTVVIEAGLGSPTSLYAALQDAVAPFRRVCVYDRAGIGWSEAAQDPFEADAAPQRLHDLLAAAGVEPPYALAGHSLGGLLIRSYARLHPEDVAALVFLDPSHPDQVAALDLKRDQQIDAAVFEIGRIAAVLGATEVFNPWPYDYATLPEDARRRYDWYVRRPKNYRGLIDELARFDALAAAAGTVGDLADTPLLVISAGRTPDGFAPLHEEIAGLSRLGRRVVVEDAGHVSLIADPRFAAIVARAIEEELEGA